MAAKKTQGRQRIEIKKLEKKSSKQVTFSKRRSGLFKKAGELSVLCGSEVAIIIFSPSDKLFCFAHPNVDSLIDRFLNRSTAPPELAESSVPVAEFNRSHAEAVRNLESEKRNAASAMECAKRSSGGFWWNLEIEDLELEELKQHTAALVEMRRRVAERIERMAALKRGSLVPAMPMAHSVYGAAENQQWW